MESNPKSQVVERLREAQNVLVTVSANPSVDQLAAAIGFTLMMNKLGKHATAVFSGHVPSTLEFLKPESTLEQNTDSLRDFIISLDKAKADKLRYKVEDDFVKIFITPYRTSLTDADLNFSQGDFNIDVVMALGVDKRDHVDQAILEHGRILHDATVIGVMAGPTQVDIGSINWQDTGASSLCEMLVGISESFQSGLLDSQMATAFLTGVVAETERFSNEKTSSKVMTMSAQLMAAGANQQLIATQLNPAVVVNKNASESLPEPVDPENEIPQNEAVLDLHHEDDASHQEEPVKKQTNEELVKAVNDVQENMVSPHTVLQPFQPEPEIVPNKTSKYILEPPVNGGTLTANSEPENYDPSIDPLSEPTNKYYETREHEKSVVLPLIGITDDAESIRAATMPSTASPFLPSDGETNTLPAPDQDLNFEIPSAKDEFESDIPVIDKLGPDVNEKDTLTDIEQAVQNFSGVAPHPSDPVEDTPPADDEGLNTDAARQAVMDAVNATAFDVNRPDPIQALNAQELPQEPTMPELRVSTPSDTDVNPISDQPTPQIVEPTTTMPSRPFGAPPSVPPPMLPQFPIPGAEVYEPDQDPRNTKN